MSLVELLLCSAVFTVSAPSIFISFSSCMKGVEKVVVKTNYIKTILSTDRKIRDFVWNLDIPYWKSRDEFLTEKIHEIYNIKLDEDVQILDVHVVRDEDGIPSGLNVFWKFKYENYETAEFF